VILRLKQVEQVEQVNKRQTILLTLTNTHDIIKTIKLIKVAAIHPIR